MRKTLPLRKPRPACRTQPVAPAPEAAQDPAAQVRVHRTAGPSGRTAAPMSTSSQSCCREGLANGLGGQAAAPHGHQTVPLAMRPPTSRGRPGAGQAATGRSQVRAHLTRRALSLQHLNTVEGAPGNPWKGTRPSCFQDVARGTWPRHPEGWGLLPTGLNLESLLKSSFTTRNK